MTRRNTNVHAMNRLVRKVFTESIGAEPYETLFPTTIGDGEDRHTVLFFVKLCVFLKHALGKKSLPFRPEDLPSDSKDHVKQMKRLLRKVGKRCSVEDVYRSVRFARDNARRQRERAAAIKSAFVRLQAIFRGRRVRSRMTQIYVKNDCERRRKTIGATSRRATQTTKTTLRTPAPGSSAPGSRETDRGSTDRKTPKRPTLFDRAWLEKWDTAFDAMVHETDRL